MYAIRLSKYPPKMYVYTNLIDISLMLENPPGQQLNLGTQKP